MKNMFFLFIAGCGSGWHASKVYPFPNVVCEEFAGQDYEVQILDTDLPNLVKEGEITNLVWYLDLQSEQEMVNPCFELALYQLPEQYLIEDLGSWLQPSNGVVQEEIVPGPYTLVYDFRGYQSGTIGLELSDGWQKTMGHWSIKVSKP